MKKYLSMTLIAIVLIMSMTACGKKSAQDIVSDALDLDVSDGVEASNVDTHGGFHNDGITSIVLTFNDDAVLKTIRDNSKWKTFPLDHTVQTLVYGVQDKTSSYGPYLTDDGEPLVPEIRNGYYLLIDRHAEKDKETGADILNRHSFNFDLGIYDTDTDTLYFCRLDT